MGGIPESKRKMKKVFSSRYVHLCIFLLVLAGVSWGATYTSDFEKIADCVEKYCLADYMARESIHQKDRLGAEYYRDRYERRLQSLTADLFYYRDASGKREYFLSKGFLYDEWQEAGGRSYLLAEILDKGSHEMDLSGEVRFYYMVLGKGKVRPFVEHKHGPNASPLVSPGEKGVYIHRDRLERILTGYFDRLWDSKIGGEKDFHWSTRTYCLYRDLQEVCQDVFVKKVFRNKANARRYFVAEGLKVYFPALLAMGARMAADQAADMKSRERYERALLTGLAHSPSHTMLHLISRNPWLFKLGDELGKRLDFGSYPDDPDQITLDQISQAAKDIFEIINERGAHHKG